MESIETGDLERIAALRTELASLEQNIARQQEMADQLRREEWQREFAEKEEAREQTAKDSVFALLGTTAVREDEPITLRDHWYDHGFDGFDTSIDYHWLLALEGEVVIFCEETQRVDGGWSGSKRSGGNRLWLFSEALDAPLGTSGAAATIESAGLQTDLTTLKPATWRSLQEGLGTMCKSIVRQESLALADRLLSQFGKHEREGFTDSGQRIPDQRARDRLILEAVDDEYTVWRLMRKHDPFDGTLESYIVDCTNSWAKDGFQIELMPNNMEPYIWGAHSGTLYHDVRKRSIELFQQGVKVIESATNPTLFDPTTVK